MSLKLSFYGGAGKVTGSNFLIEGSKGRVLVDCGIEQGADFAEAEVYGPFPYDVKSIDALVVTHAHLDHVGRVPKLVRDGFKGKIVMTPATRDLAALILLDSAHILAEEAARLGRAPLYDANDVEAAFALVETLDYHVEKEVAPGLSAYFRNTGHILGSASVRIKDEEGVSVALSGDIGNSPSPLLPDWEPVPDADALVMESTYGDKLHGQGDRNLLLKESLQSAIKRGGTILIPAFSMERTQLMLYELSNFFADGSLPKIPVFLDSPLAIHVTAVYEKWGMTYFKPETEDEMKREGSIFEFPFLKQTLAREDSEAIERVSGPKIIIAGAGMSHGGRIGRWETRYLPDLTTTLFMVGYQAPGTPGRRMMEGAPSVRIAGAEVKIQAKIEKLEGWSAHADRDQLLAFAEASLPQKGGHTKTIFVAHGEPSAERHLAQRIHDYLGARAIVPEYGETWIVEKDSVKKV
ncbi:MAG: MBL fold metallo-hydrolase [Candidatus Pacebacteria bacterium]|nr:MBL fold metallo-hydrolase [Candidatus Paceibacterota bacterium]